MSAGVVLRSCLFFLLQLLLTPPYAVIAVLTFPFNALTRYRIISVWARLMMLALDHLCGIKFRVIGAENIPSEPCVILSKHQSAWETFAFQLIFPPQVYVIKRELLWIPFFGWGLAMCSPIAINRGAGPRAARQMLSQGKDRLARGFCVIVYPEGTRVAPGTRGKYQSSGSAIAVSIGPPLNTTGRKADALTREVETWIENEMQQIDHAGA